MVGRSWLVTIGLMLVACGGKGTGAVDAGGADDGGVDAAPTGFQPDPVTMGEQLPSVMAVMKVRVNGATIERDVPVPGTIEIFEEGASAATFTSAIAFEGRGNFTWTLPKKGYAFEIQDGAGGDVERAILGMPKGSDFALYACYTDKTCLRNALVFAIGQQLGRWSPRTRFVELYIDDSYRGLYMVWERIRRDGDRVALPADGYIVRHEGGGEGGGADFTTRSNVIYSYHYPRPEVITVEQKQFIQGAFQAFEDAIAAAPSSYATTIDEASWLDRSIVEEVTNNWDGYVHSIYMTRDAEVDGGRVGMGPLWDFDLAFANGNVTGYNCRTDVWAYEIQRGFPDDVPVYWRTLLADPTFQHAWKCRYQALRQTALAQSTFDARIDAWVAFTAAARARDQQTWPTVGMQIFPNCTNQPSYAAEVAFLRGWISDRLAWLDARAAEMPGTCP